MPLGQTLWLLRIKDPDHKKYGFDCAYGMVVRAISPSKARILAALQAGDEGPDTWHNSDLTSCHKLKEEGKTGVVIIDYRAG